jgi:hypothetical protein
MRGGELAAGGERDATPGGRRLWVKRWSKRETERETHARQWGEDKVGPAWRHGSRGGGAAVGWGVAIRWGDAREMDAGNPMVRGGAID